MLRTRFIALSLLALLMLSSACGKKGPLYHPGNEDKATEASPSTEAGQNSAPSSPTTAPGE